jgi:hypothetical protein
LNLFSIRFLVRRGCHLCDDARPLVKRAARGSGAGILEVDIDTDEDLLERYGLRIPVVLGPGDVVLAEGVIEDLESLRRAIRESVPD